MSRDAAELAHRYRILIVPLVPIGLAVNTAVSHTLAVSVSAFFKKPVGKVAIFLFTCNGGQLYQRKFYLFVAGNPVALVGAKGVHHMVGHFDGNVKKLALACGLVVGHGGFGHVAGAIHFVLVHVAPTLVQSGKGIECVDIAVRLLGCGKFGYPFVGLLLEFGIGLVDKAVGYTFHCFVYVGIVEEYAGVLTFVLGCILKVADTSGLVLNLVDAHIERGGGMALKAWLPE